MVGNVRAARLTQGDLCKAFYERYGKDTLPIISEVMSKTGTELAKNMKQKLQGKGLIAVGELWRSKGLDMVTLTGDVIHFKKSPHASCTYGLEGTTLDLCEAMMHADKNMVSTMAEEEVEIEILKSVAAGDEYCEVIITRALVDIQDQLDQITP